MEHHPTELSAEPAAVSAPDGRRPFVVIDAYNFGLERGTGVATYGRNLSFGLRDIGCDVGVLYGGPFSAGRSSLLREIQFFESQALTLSPLQRAWRRLRASLAPSWNTAFEVPISGAVVSEGLASRLPHYDAIWNAPDLYLKAITQFNAFGAINRVSMRPTPDICHWTYPLPLRLRGTRNIYTLHDLVPLRLPHTTLDRKERYFRLVKWICRTASHIVTVSEHSKRDIVSLMNVDPEKVTNTYQAVSIPEEYRLKTEQEVQRQVEGVYGLPYKEYFLFFGSIEPKKNVDRLIEAFVQSGVDTPLVVIRAQTWQTDRNSESLLTRLTGRHAQPDSFPQAAGRVMRLEYVPFPQLVILIRGAKAVLFPSLYEGFGLPILESMLLGTPVLSSRTSSIPEVAGDAALLVDPYDARAIADGVRALDSNDELRADLSARGRRRAAMFSEAAYRQRLANVYEKVLASG